ncbi:inhibitory synaptic factor 1 [Grus japonensis]|uniref:Inhibitory synaptic factor 1 n=1 Tax=Grus japonensis TaxID=30415 RepID=A0ABC9X915_GRUJA
MRRYYGATNGTIPSSGSSLPVRPSVCPQVVNQIDRLTSDFEFELEPDDWTTATASSTSSSEKGGGAFELGPLDFAASDILSDSWEFCSFLDASTPSDPGDGPEPPRPQPQPPPVRQPDYRLMNGGIPITNGPRGGGTPDSSSEEAFGATAGQKISHHRPAGTRERVRFSDKVLYHALCCDDDRDGDSTVSPGDDGPEEPGHKVLAGPPSKHPSAGSGGHPARRLTRNSSTQTVADKSTQTVLPYIPAKQKIKNKN